MVPLMFRDHVQLSDEELVDIARTGDDRSIELLLSRYRHYARAKARAYFLAGADKEDIIQEGMIGLYKAIRDFQGNRRIAFRAFAELCITRQIITAIKSATRQKHQPLNAYVSLQATIQSDEGEERPVADVIDAQEVPDPADVVVASEEVSVIRSSIGTLLSEMEGEVLQQYIEGRSYHDIAVALGREPKSIDNALQRIKRKLSRHVHHRRGAYESGL